MYVMNRIKKIGIHKFYISTGYFTDTSAIRLFNFFMSLHCNRPMFTDIEILPKVNIIEAFYGTGNRSNAIDSILQHVKDSNKRVILPNENRVLGYQLYNKFKPYVMRHYEDKNINYTTAKMVPTQLESLKKIKKGGQESHIMTMLLLMK